MFQTHERLFFLLRTRLQPLGPKHWCSQSVLRFVTPNSDLPANSGYQHISPDELRWLRPGGSSQK